MDPDLVIILLTLLASAFFSGMEIAFISANRLKVELDKNQGTFNGKIIGRYYQKESFFIAMLLLGNNIALVLFGISAARILDPVIQSWGVVDGSLILLIQTIISTILVLVTAEFLPKTLVQLNPNTFLNVASLPMFIIYIALYLPTHVVVWISSWVLKLFKTEKDSSERVFSKVDLEHFVADLSERMNDEEDLGNEMQILQNALDFSSLRARDCMVPRTEIQSVDIDSHIDALIDKFIETGMSKIVVYRGNIDNIIGYVHSFELFKRPEAIKHILLPISFVPAAIHGKELLELFAKQSGNIAVVVDEYGGTAGLVTLEDLIEEIFGDIEDEHDIEEWLEQDLGDGSYKFSGRIDIEYLNEEYGLKLPENDDYDTLGGLIIHELESIPEAGTSIDVDEYTLHIEEVSDRRIEVVRIVSNK